VPGLFSCRLLTFPFLSFTTPSPPPSSSESFTSFLFLCLAFSGPAADRRSEVDFSLGSCAGRICPLHFAFAWWTFVFLVGSGRQRKWRDTRGMPLLTIPPGLFLRSIFPISYFEVPSRTASPNIYGVP